MKPRQLWTRYASQFAALLFVIGIGSCSQACCWWFAQPKVPARLDKYMNEQ